MAVLVTGVGYIGAKLVERLLERGEEVAAVDNFFSTDARVVNGFGERKGFKLVKGSVTNVKALRSAFSSADISAVYSLAAQASASPQAASIRYTENTNLLGPRLLLDCMREFGVSKVVYASSFKVYGQALPPVVTEDAPYGAFGDLSHLSKCYSEKLLEMYASLHGLTCLSIRLGIVYGLSPVMKTDYRFMTAPNKFCLQAARGDDIELHPGCDLPTGFIHVADAADIMVQACDESSFSGYVPINAVAETCSIAQVAEFVAAEAERRGLSVKIRRPAAAEMPRVRQVAVSSRFEAFFRQPRRRLQETVGEVIDYFRT